MLSWTQSELFYQSIVQMLKGQTTAWNSLRSTYEESTRVNILVLLL